MSKICIFGGTTEGRKLAEFLSGQPCDVMVCVATDYGQTLLPEAEHVSVSARRLPVGEIVSLLTEHRFDLVIDATHPYAQSITKSIARACRETGTLRWRLLRGASGVSPEHTYVETVSDVRRFCPKLREISCLQPAARSWRDFRSFPAFPSASGRACFPCSRPWMRARRQGSRPRTFLRCRARFLRP